MKMHRLPDGTEVLESTYMSVMSAVRELDLVDLIGAVDLARDPGHKLSKKTEKTLRDLGLINKEGEMHDVTSQILRNLK